MHVVNPPATPFLMKCTLRSASAQMRRALQHRAFVPIMSLIYTPQLAKQNKKQLISHTWSRMAARPRSTFMK